MMRPISILLSLFLLSGCSVINMTKGPGDYYRHWYAEDLKESIDSSIRDESAKGAPPGFTDRTYSEENWNESWNRRIHAILDGEFHEAYVGPTQEEFYLYIISERRKAGLPELNFSEKTKAMIEQVGSGQPM
jgi:uncharacterized protein YceK